MPTCFAGEVEFAKLKPKTMDLLVFLAENHGRVVSKDQIFEAVWTDTFVGDTVLWKCISELRQVLGEDPKNPQIILTIPKRGYRLDLPQSSHEPEPSLRRKRWRPFVIVASVLVLLLLGWWFTQDSTIQNAPLPVSERPPILVAQIGNQTGESILDGSLEYAFESNLLSSEMLRTVSRTRIQETLRLMGMSVDTPLDVVLARELSQARELSFVTGVPYILDQALIMLESARLYEATGERSRAIKVLEELSSMRTQSYPATGVVWLFGQAHLADLYRLEGRAKEADSIEDELRELLKFADDDHPLRVKLTQ